MNMHALHEAAHAVTARALGVAVELVTIRPGEHEGTRYAGRVQLYGADRWTRSVIAFAPIEAAKRLAENPNVRVDLAEELDGCRLDLADFRDASPAATEAGRAMRDRAMDRAYEIVRKRWNDIERVAIELERRGTLDDLDLAEILRAREAGGVPGASRRPAPAPARRSNSRPAPGAGPSPARRGRRRGPAKYVTCIREHIGRDGERILEGGRFIADHRDVLTHPRCFAPLST
jgi:hypothetical protein